MTDPAPLAGRDASAPRAGRSDLGAIRAGGRVLAFRAADLQRIERVGAIVPLPGAAPHLAGLTSARGRLVPAFSLAGLLGLPETGGSPRWLALVRGDEPFGLLFDELRSYVPLEPRAPATTDALAAGDEAATSSAEPNTPGPAVAEPLGETDWSTILDVAALRELARRGSGERR